MFRAAPVALILAVMLTSIGLGAARGTIRSGSEVVLCTGHGVVVTILPDDQGREAHLCPDMALSMLAAVATAAVAMPRPATAVRSVPPLSRDIPRPFRRMAIRVRDPPAANRA